jgi:hypothetical protein
MWSKQAGSGRQVITNDDPPGNGGLRETADYFPLQLFCFQEAGQSPENILCAGAPGGRGFLL